MALQGNWSEEQLFMLKQALSRCDDIDRHLAGGDARLDALPDVRAATKMDIGTTPRSGSKARAEYDIHRQLGVRRFLRHHRAAAHSAC